MILGGRYSTVMVSYSQYLKAKSESDERLAGQKANADRLLDEERRKREADEMREAEEKKNRVRVNSWRCLLRLIQRLVFSID